MSRFSVKQIWETLVLAVGLATGLASCTEVVQIDLDSTYRRLVVYGAITTDSVKHRVQLTTTSDYFSNKPAPAIDDALVELEFKDQKIRLEALPELPGVFETPVALKGIPGTTYSLSISQVDVNEDGVEEEYRARTTLPDGMQLDSIVLNPFASPFISGTQVFMYGQDPPTREWYAFKLWRNGDLLTDTLVKYIVQPDDFFNGIYINGLPVGFLSNEVAREAALPGDTITFEINSIDQDFYNFILEAQTEVFGSNPLFSGPPANVFSNLGNEGRGIFTSYAVQRVSAIVPSQ